MCAHTNRTCGSAQSGKRLAVLGLPPGVTYGMCMSMHAFRQGGLAHLAVGYEAGHVAVWRLSEGGQPLVAAQLHKEAVMALALDSHAAGGNNNPVMPVSIQCAPIDEHACTSVMHESFMSFDSG